MKYRQHVWNRHTVATAVLALNFLLTPFATTIIQADTLPLNPPDRGENTNAIADERDSYPVVQRADNYTFVSDVTIPDGTVMKAGESFTKTWRVKNSGSTTWKGYTLAFSNGDQMDAMPSVAVPTTAPEESADIRISMIAPTKPGLHKGNWQIRTADATGFGNVFVLIAVKGTRTLADLETDLRDDSPDVRKKAVEDLIAFGPQAVPILTQVLKKDADAGMRAMAVGALSEMTPLNKEALKEIFAALNDTDEGVKYVTLEVIYAIGPKLSHEAVPTLIEALTDPNLLAQRMAMQSLGVLGPAAKEATPALREYVIREPNKAFADQALQLINALESQMP